jgi:hypothetical protein
LSYVSISRRLKLTERIDVVCYDFHSNYEQCTGDMDQNNIPLHKSCNLIPHVTRSKKTSIRTELHGSLI